ncbi:MAG: hypothetical protein K9L70_15745 [Thiohalocapsa sp.]|nr:hypothetical protein [Thiohalocapsa sp.]
MAKLLITDRPLCLIGSIQVKDWPLTQCLARARPSMARATVNNERSLKTIAIRRATTNRKTY